MTIDQKQEEIIEDFNEIIEEFNDKEIWEIRYRYITELGNHLPPIDEKYKTPDHLIEGCQSRVWLNAEYKDGKVVYTADADAIIVKGLISLLIDVLSGHTPDEILSSDLRFIDAIGLGENLSPTRSNGLLAMVKQMRLYALAFKEQHKED